MSDPVATLWKSPPLKPTIELFQNGSCHIEWTTAQGAVIARADLCPSERSIVAEFLSDEHVARLDRERSAARLLEMWKRLEEEWADEEYWAPGITRRIKVCIEGLADG